MTANRSRLVQELLEQNSAVLQKLKDRTEVTHGDLPVELLERSTEVTMTDGNQQNKISNWTNNRNNSDISIHHHPFPRHNPEKRPKDVTVKLGLYNSPQKY